MRAKRQEFEYVLYRGRWNLASRLLSGFFQPFSGRPGPRWAVMKDIFNSFLLYAFSFFVGGVAGAFTFYYLVDPWLLIIDFEWLKLYLGVTFVIGGLIAVGTVFKILHLSKNE